MRTRTVLALLLAAPLAWASRLPPEYLTVMPPALSAPSSALGGVTTSFTLTDSRGDGVVGQYRTNIPWVVQDLTPAWAPAVRRALQDAGAVVVAPGAEAPWSLTVEVARMTLNADMLGGSVDIATSFTLMRGNEQVWRKNFNKKTKINVYTDLGKVLAKVLAGVLEDGLERAGQQYATAVAAAPAAAAPLPKAAPSQPQLAVLDFHGPLAPATLRLLADEARGGVLEAGGGKYLIMTREAVNARLKDKGKCAGDEDACDLEAGKGSGADLIVTGTVAKLGKRLRASLKVMDMKSGALVASKSFSAENEEGLADLVKANASAALRDAQPH